MSSVSSGPPSMAVPPAPGHDHGACLARGLAEAKARCEDKGAKLTAARSRVLEILLRDAVHGALGAYDIIERIAEAGQSRPAPMSVYRALDFLVELGLVHRITSLNAFVACAHPRKDHGAQFLICRNCRAVTELTDTGVNLILKGAADAVDFEPEPAIVEVPGLCVHCRSGTARP
ncbi:MAG: transcriptional repressor [Rhodospirillum sp.]|nr:transcriptional repressor [Rhodospirillum sp.]MCF8487806.1 transcriptional repressor [Rhodospirillum sp.]MCF8499904.1 transcriptional repressor [Rhodospirillum sp.]